VRVPCCLLIVVSCWNGKGDLERVNLRGGTANFLFAARVGDVR
jgi:hypothetical protein